jgi:hydrogenase-4 component E
MEFLLIIIFAMTLVHLATAERLTRHIWLLGIQGVLLFGIALLRLSHIDISHLLFILTETLVFKAFFVPIYLERIRKYNHVSKVSKKPFPAYYSAIFSGIAIGVGFLMGYYLHETHMHSKILSISVSAMIVGLYIIIVHQTVLSHMMGYLVIENGIFLLSLAVGTEMPIMVSGAVLLDIFIGVLVLGLFINRVGDKFHDMSAENLTSLKD